MRNRHQLLGVMAILVFILVFVSGGLLVYREILPVEVALANRSGVAALASQMTDHGPENLFKTIEMVPDPDKPAKDNVAPKIIFEDVVVAQGTEVNFLDNVTANDNVDRDVTAKINAAGDFNKDVLGEYRITLSVSDQAGNVATVEKKIIVEAAASAVTLDHQTNPAPAVDTPAPVANNSATNNAPAAVQPAAPQTNSPVPAAPVYTAPAYASMTMYISGSAVPYQNGGQGSGQGIIDGNPYGTASTWGGAASQSGSDGMNTHFIGHNPGIFAAIFNLGSGSQIVVTDSSGTATTYTVSSVFQTDDSAIGISDGVNYWSTITGAGGGERITLQACVSTSINLIVVAYA